MMKKRKKIISIINSVKIQLLLLSLLLSCVFGVGITRDTIKNPNNHPEIQNTIRENKQANTNNESINNKDNKTEIHINLFNIGDLFKRNKEDK